MAKKVAQIGFFAMFKMWFKNLDFWHEYCLVTLFDYKLQVFFKILAKMDQWDFFFDFQTLCNGSTLPTNNIAREDVDLSKIENIKCDFVIFPQSLSDKKKKKQSPW